MKSLLMCAAFLALVFAGCVKQEVPVAPPESAETTKTEAEPATEAIPMTVHLKIEGMHCVNCKAKVEKILLEVPGVESAEADNEAHSAVVKLKPGASFDEAAARDKLDVEMFQLTEVSAGN
jgi:copper chaperone CopZ